MIFGVEFVRNCACFFIDNLEAPIHLNRLEIIKCGHNGLVNALLCHDIGRLNNGELVFKVNGMWLIFRKEDGSKLSIYDVPQILQVTFKKGITIRVGETTVPDAFCHLAEQINKGVVASQIAPDMFAKDAEKIQAAKKKARPHTPTPS